VSRMGPVKKEDPLTHVPPRVLHKRPLVTALTRETVRPHCQAQEHKRCHFALKRDRNDAE
jgi:hypothetical protein